MIEHIDYISKLRDSANFKDSVPFGKNVSEGPTPILHCPKSFQQSSTNTFPVQFKFTVYDNYSCLSWRDYRSTVPTTPLLPPTLISKKIIFSHKFKHQPRRHRPFGVSKTFPVSGTNVFIPLTGIKETG